MCDSCGTCLLLPEKFHCGWCSATLTCEVTKQCNADWLDRSQTCPNPRILSFEPRTGPWEGGTNITIRGIDLGKHFGDISVTLGAEGARIPCTSLPDRYVATKEIVCTAGGAAARNISRGRIVAQIAGYRAESTDDFQFVDPQIFDFEPRLGIISGGTRIRISGNHLNAGGDLKTFLGDQPCRILSVAENEAFCQTSPVFAAISAKLQMHFDENVRTVEAVSFQYVPDPTIYFAESGPSSYDAYTINAIPAGGIKITVVGLQFEAIQSPILIVYLGEKKFIGVCNVTHDTIMECDSPKIDFENLILSSYEPLKPKFDFKLDGWSGSPRMVTKFKLYPNPIYYRFQETVRYLMGNYLTIDGKDLDQACDASDVLVKIGDSTCNKTWLSPNQLTCLLPLEAAETNE